MDDPHYDYDAFISYSHEDSEVARRIEGRLKKLCENGSDPRIFLDTSSIEPGDNFVDRINAGLLKSRYYLLLLSPASIKAEWPTAERDAALLSDPSGRGGRVVPILVKDCDIPPLLAIRHWIDARDERRLDAGMAGLASKITGRAPPHGAAGGTAQTVSEGTALAAPPSPYSHEPDAADEVLYTNLYKVKRTPTIRSAPAKFSTKRKIWQELRCRLPPFALHEGMLYTSSGIECADNALRPAINTDSITEVAPGFWLENDDNKRILTSLLNSHAGRHCEEMGLSRDKTGRRYYGDKTLVTSEKLQWLSHVRKGSRALIIPYEKDGVIQFYRHRALRPSFHVLGNEVFLQINPGWTFTHDGSAIIVDQKKRSALNTRLRSYGGNDDEFTEQRFWAWLLSRGGQIEMGERDNPVQIEYVPLKFTSHVGLYGDRRPVSFNQGDPPRIALGKDCNDGTKGGRGE